MRTFDDIIPPSRRQSEPGPAGQPPPRPPLRVAPPARFPYKTLVVALLVIAASIAALFYFSTAKVTVTPNSVSAAVQGSFTANKSSGVLPFEVITAQKIATRSVKGSGTRTANAPASGTITIYNAQSKPQALVATTRFATAAGLIFRIRTAVTVPAGSASSPGSVQATVYADQPGSTYNIGPTSFTVPGFAGTPQATAVYARSTAPMTGGISGTVPTVDSVLEVETVSALKAALGPDLDASLKSQIPAGYVLVPGAAVTTYEELTPTPSATTGMVEVKEQGTITAVVFPNAALAKAIAESVPGLGYQGEPVTLRDTAGLTLASADGIDAGTPTFAFTMSGTAPLVYTVDASRIAAAVSGKTRSAAEVALTNYPEVKSAVIILRPFWRSSFPQDPASISVIVAPAAH